VQNGVKNQEIEPVFIEPDKHIWFADFEADVCGKIHKPYMLCARNATGSKSLTFFGEECGSKFLDELENGDLVYFHNLAYDFSFLAKHGVSSMIPKGNRNLQSTIIYGSSKAVQVKFHDSLAMIPSKLAEFPQMFGLKNVKKEKFPYRYYTLDDIISSKIGIISEAGKSETPIWKSEDYAEFISNIDAIPNCRLGPNEFDMKLYAQFYCMQDVEILRQGFNKFREQIMLDFDGIDIVDFLTISALTDELIHKYVYVPNTNLYKVGGVVREFCQQSIRGGRCMTANNNSYYVKKPMLDIDAVSLYPSAMMRLYTVEGLPEVIKKEELAYETSKNNSTAFIIEIEVIAVNKHLAFPLTSY
jgi:hypothetical protein